MGNPAVSSKPNRMLNDCTACPLAPLTRLSSALKTRSRSGARVGGPADFDCVCAVDVFGVGQSAAAGEPHERLVGVALGQAVGDGVRPLGKVVRLARRGGEVKRGENAAVHRNQVRRELNGDRRAVGQAEFLLDLGQVPVLGHAVRPEALVALDVQKRHVGLAPGTADAAQRVGDDLLGIDQPGLEQRNGRQQDARRVTAGRGDERRVGDGVAPEFRQPVNGLGQPLRRGVFGAVKLVVRVGVVEAEVGAQVDHRHTALGQRHGKLGGDAVGQGEENGLRLIGEQVDRRLGKRQVTGSGMAGEAREDRGHRLAGILARSQHRQVDVRMLKQQAHQFLAGVTGGTHDRNIDFFS